MKSNNFGRKSGFSFNKRNESGGFYSFLKYKKDLFPIE